MSSLDRRSTHSLTWITGASIVSAVVLFGRAVVLARLLPVEVFGVYAGAKAFVLWTVVFAGFGMGDAFLHRSPETLDENRAARAHLTLTSILTVAWAGISVAGAWVLTDGGTRTALILLTATTAGIQLAETPRLVLIRRVLLRRLAVIQIVGAIATTAVAIVLASAGATLWALLATDVTTLVVTLAALYVWRPPWKPRFGVSRREARYFLRFGSRSFVAGLLEKSIRRADDIWTRLALGTTPLGFYSRAFTFADYPQKVVGLPIGTTAGGTLAEARDDRGELTRHFARFVRLVMWSACLMAGALGLAAPEFIRIVIGDRWLPMLDAFRLLLVYAVTGPLIHTSTSLFIAVGRPDVVVRARFAQLVTLVVGLVALGPSLEIAGVALAVTAAAALGAVVLLWRSGEFVDLAATRHLGGPLAALAAGLMVGAGAVLVPAVGDSVLLAGLAKTVGFAVGYGALLLTVERQWVIDRARAIAGRTGPRR